MVLSRIFPKLLFRVSFLEKIFLEKILDSRSKGLDKMSAQHFEKIKSSQFDIIIKKCLNETFEFTPYLELLKIKSAKTPPRTISIATIRDRNVLYCIKKVLTTEFPECVNKKRPNRYIHEIKKFIEKNEQPIHFIKVDIERFYDTINRDRLYSILKDKGINRTFLTLIKKAIENPTIPPNTKRDDRKNFIKDVGIPQGLAISNILAQIYLSSLDEDISKRKFLYLRYVDDIMILNNGPITSFRKKNIISSLQKLKLSINQGKTSEGAITMGVTFLSYYINNKTISVSEKNIQIYLRKIAAKFTWFKNGIDRREKRESWLEDDDRFKEVFLEDLNEIITGSRSENKNYGWLFYFSEMNDLSLLFKLDKIIETFFLSLDSFTRTPPVKLKRLVRAYYSIKHGTNMDYINNYNDYNTIRKKRNYLIFRGAIDPDTAKSDIEIEYSFERFKNKKIKSLEKDLGYHYSE
ncbi:reverse transcriptase domain-containing protein [Sphingobacterium spiritivorum]|uniref:reverse transcriptase domain-containing protein n=1 Tax=Sphingobacterium spiritivorum TaxID=258 RepID=UPI003DA5A305